MQRSLHLILAGFIQRTWLLVGVTAIVCSVFAAHAVAALVEAKYLAPPSHGVSLPTPPAQAPAPPRSRDGGALVTRNMFCSECTPQVDPGLGPLDTFTPNAMLIATSIGADSRATMRVLDTEAAGSWGVGDMVPGVGTITRIGWVSVDLVDATGRHGKVTLLDAPTMAAGRGDPGAATPGPAAAAEPWEGRIKKIDDHTFEVERALVRELVSGTTKAGTIRITPISKGGKLEALKLYGVRPGSLAASLGLRNGDALSDVNGAHIESLNTLLDMYTNIDQLSVVQFEGTRGGKPLGIELRLK
jgi:hypothetical protein